MNKAKKPTTDILRALCERIVAYNVTFAKICGSVTAGLLLSQIAYWWFKMGEKEFYKTDKEFREELGLGRWEFQTAKKKLSLLGFITVKVKGLPPRTYYTLNVKVLENAILKYSKHLKEVNKISAEAYQKALEVLKEKKQELVEKLSLSSGSFADLRTQADLEASKLIRKSR